MQQNSRKCCSQDSFIVTCRMQRMALLEQTDEKSLTMAPGGTTASVKALSSLPPAMVECHPLYSWLLQQYASSSLIRERAVKCEKISILK